MSVFSGRVTGNKIVGCRYDEFSDYTFRIAQGGFVAEIDNFKPELEFQDGFYPPPTELTRFAIKIANLFS